MQNKMGNDNSRCVSSISVLVQHTRFICRHHVFDVNKSIFTTMTFKSFQGFLDQITNVLSLLLAVINSIAGVTFEKETKTCIVQVYRFRKLGKLKLQQKIEGTILPMGLLAAAPFTRSSRDKNVLPVRLCFHYKEISLQWIQHN